MSNPIEEPAPQPVDEPVTVTAGVAGGSVTLTQHMLGLDPYVLIRAVKVDPEDPDDDGLRLEVESGGGAGHSGGELATLYVLNLPAEQNPITAAIKAVIDANPDEHVIPEVLAMFAEFCDVPMPESGS